MNQFLLAAVSITGLSFLASAAGGAKEQHVRQSGSLNVAPEPAPNIPREEERARRADAARGRQELTPIPALIPLAPSVGPAQTSTDGNWLPQGPGPTQAGQVENVFPDDEVVGALHTVVAHPADAAILWAGGTNGGIWKTTNATAISPNWTALTDDLPSLSIGALELDPTDNTNQTLIAGTGRFSSFARFGGPLVGLLRTVDDGSTWTRLGESDLAGRNITGVGPRGSTIVVSASANAGGVMPGIYRSTDGGASFTQISGTNGLPFGTVFDLTGDPGNHDRFYAGLRTGIFRSDDAGLNWTNITDFASAALLGDATNNVEFAVHDDGGDNVVYVAIMNDGQLAGLLWSNDQGDNWTAMDIPQTNEGGAAIGIQPRVKPGAQGSIHFSIAADPEDANTVYVGGDRQPLNAGPDGIADTEDDFFPNSLGAVNFSGRLFRGDTSIAPSGSVPSPQWEHLTHLDSIAEIPDGGTANSSSPHADSREMVFDANGDLIETDDGGIYRRTNPRDNSGDWFSINGNLQTTEFHDIAYDTVADIIMGGAQDTGTHQQNTPGGATYTDIFQADGGDVAVDSTSVAGQSTRFWSFQFLQVFSRYTCDSLNVCGDLTFIGLNEPGGAITLEPGFVTPVELNVADQTRLIIGGENAVYESFDQGDNITQIPGPGTGFLQNAMLYGHRNNSEFIAIGFNSGVFVRSIGGGSLVSTPTFFPGAQVRDITVDPADENRLYVVDEDGRVFQTLDRGTNWTDITGNLVANGAGIRTIEYIEQGNNNDRLVVGSNAGVLVSFEGIFDLWFRLGTGLPNVPNWDMDYDSVDDVLVVGTLGRGAWLIDSASERFPTCDPNTPGAIVGTPEADQLTGTARDDVIIGLGGDDQINGRGGNDCIDGGAGADAIVAGKGDDLIFGGSDNDNITSGAGGDVVFGETGNDTITGGPDDDTLEGGKGFDRLTGGLGTDKCVNGELVIQCE